MSFNIIVRFYCMLLVFLTLDQGNRLVGIWGVEIGVRENGQVLGLPVRDR